FRVCDLTFSMTLVREPINPRPMGIANIFRFTAPDTIVFITYSEGCNDDVNKAVWSALGWDSQANVEEILREYARYFISPKITESFADGLLSLEKNWQGAALSNDGIGATFQRFIRLEQAATPQMKLNWRFQQALYRAYYDAYEHDRLVHETALEQLAFEE